MSLSFLLAPNAEEWRLFMASEMVNEIVKAEKAAEESRAAAHERAADIVREAQDASARLLSAAQRKARADGDARVKAARDSYTASVENAAREAARQSTAIRSAAKRRRDKAVKAVVDYII